MMGALFLPGEDVLGGDGYIRGHGTRLRNENIASTYFGRLRITNKLVTVDPACPLRYTPEVGDVVVGRVVAIQSKKWRVELNARGDVHLGLSAINLPGVVQRRKLESDEMSMRSFFDIGDLVVSEVQKVNKNGTSALHTRSDRYGKLGEGVLVFVPHFLVEPLKSRFLSSSHVDAVVGCNGYVWVGSRSGLAGFAEVARVVSWIKAMAQQGKRINVERVLEGDQD